MAREDERVQAMCREDLVDGSEVGGFQGNELGQIRWGGRVREARHDLSTPARGARAQRLAGNRR